MGLFNKKKNITSSFNETTNNTQRKPERYNRVCLHCREPLKPHYCYCPGCGIKLQDDDTINISAGTTILEAFSENPNDSELQQMVDELSQTNPYDMTETMDNSELPDLNTIRQVTKDLEKFDLEQFDQEDILDGELDEW